MANRDTDIQLGRGGVLGGDYSILVNEVIPRGHIVDKMLSFVEILAGYGLGIYVGMVIGVEAGRYVAGLRADELRLTIDFLDLNQLKQWHDMPVLFARTGAGIGALLGVAVMSIVRAKSFSREVASLYDHKITEPTEIARILARSVRKIKRTMNKLAKKDIIDYHPDAAAVRRYDDAHGSLRSGQAPL